MSIFNEILFRPLFNITVFLYDILPWNDFGLAIIVLTVIIKFIFLPLTTKSIRSQKKLSQLNPQIQQIKEKYKNNPKAQSEATLALYRESGINPLAGCLPLLIQIPILIGLYQAFIVGLKPESLGLLYGFIENPGVINQTSFWFINIGSKMPVLAILAGGLQYLQAKKSSAQIQGSGAAQGMKALNSQMLYFFPVMVIVIGWNLPAGLLLYWLATTAFSIVEQTYAQRSDK
ncbi:MAG: YidC/Oxa1 family membrane protein insertase [Candidatus Yanofskybacteria bacterium]|nr:YidC/Oxa1 family membrane protein insertase [Candidatus Yanofskybacteria bacterium]